MPSGRSLSRSLGLPEPAEAPLWQLSVPHPLNTWRPFISHCLSLQVPYRPLGGLVSSCIPGRASCVDTQHHGWVLISYNSHRYKPSLPSHRRTTMPPPPPKPPGEGAVVLSSALPPISAKLAQLKSQQYVAMKELLSDNMALHSQLEDLPASPHRLREIESPLSWVFCFMAYVAVRTCDRETRNMLTYARLVIQCHGGVGWLEWFRQQQAALTTSHPWNELNASLHVATVMSLCTGDKKLCRLCREPDHAEPQCALTSLQFPQPQRPPSPPPASKQLARPDTLEHICSSWNKGRCAFPGSCRFWHVCFMQAQRLPGQGL